jgi:signal transduction histidine kinase
MQVEGITMTQFGYNGTSGDYGRTLSKALDSIVAQLSRDPNNRCEAQILSSTGNRLLIVASTRPEEIGLTVLLDDSVSGQAFMTQAPIMLCDVKLSPFYKTLLGAHMRSELAVPLPESWGVINVENPALHAFNETDISFLQEVGRSIVAALPSAILSLELEMLAKVEQELAQRMSGTASHQLYQSICSFLCDKAQKLVGAEHMQILLVEDDGQNLGIVFSSSPTDVKRVPINKSICGQAVQRHQIRNVPDVNQEPSYQATLPQTRSELVAPAREGQEVLLIVNAESPRLDAFTKQHETLLTWFAQRAAMALRHMRLGMEVARMRDEFGAAVAFVAAADVMGHTAHEYKGKFTAIDHYRRIALQSTDAGNLRVFEALSEIENIIKSADNTHEDLRKQLESAREIRVLELNEIVRQTANNLEDEEKIPHSATLKTNLCGAIYLRASEFGMKKVIRNLLLNAFEAVQAAPSDGLIEIKTELRSEGVLPIGPCAQVTITDTGKGMSQETLAKIFSEGVTTKRRGSGFGLFWVKLYLARFRGEITIHSELSKGTSVTVWLPLAQADASLGQ